MAFFPLPYTCTIERESRERDRSGQPIITWKPVGTAKCLFLATSGARRTVVREEFEASVAFYVEADVDLQEGDRISNISGKDGVIEKGPFLAHSVKKVPNLSGRVHHQSCKLVGVA